MTNSPATFVVSGSFGGFRANQKADDGSGYFTVLVGGIQEVSYKTNSSMAEGLAVGDDIKVSGRIIYRSFQGNMVTELIPQKVEKDGAYEKAAKAGVGKAG